MRPEYDFSQGERGAPIEAPRGKTRITIRIDDDVLAWLRARRTTGAGRAIRPLINAALREHVAADEGHLERTLRRVIREELPGGLSRVAESRTP